MIAQPLSFRFTVTARYADHLADMAMRTARDAVDNADEYDFSLPTLSAVEPEETVTATAASGEKVLEVSLWTAVAKVTVRPKAPM